MTSGLLECHCQELGTSTLIDKLLPWSRRNGNGFHQTLKIFLHIGSGRDCEEIVVVFIPFQPRGHTRQISHIDFIGIIAGQPR